VLCSVREPLNEARALLAGFLSILLALWPFLDSASYRPIELIRL
jgi:hypothetical protein